MHFRARPPKERERERKMEREKGKQAPRSTVATEFIIHPK